MIKKYVNYQRETYTKLLKYTLVGVVGTIVHYLVLGGLVENSVAGVVSASSIGAVLGALVNYIINYYFTFESSNRHMVAITKFYIVAGVGFVINALIMFVVAEIFGFYYMFAQMFATAVVLLWGFIFNSVWTFRSDS